MEDFLLYLGYTVVVFRLGVRKTPYLQSLMQSEDIKEGIQSFIERRQAHFQAR